MPNLFDAADASVSAKAVRSVKRGSTISIVSLNVQSAGRERFAKIFNYIKDINPDIVVLSEVKDTSATSEFLDRMDLYGYKDTSLGKRGLDAYYTVILRGINGKSLTVDTESLRARVAITRIEVVGKKDIYIIGIYAPAYGALNLDKRKRFFSDLSNNVLSRICMAEKHVLLIGDFNMVEETYHRHIPAAVRESIPYFAKFLEHGLSDSVRHLYPEKAGYTWISPQTGEGQRLDHVFSTPEVQSWIRILSIDDSCRQSKISDHSAIHVGITVS